MTEPTMPERVTKSRPIAGSIAQDKAKQVIAERVSVVHGCWLWQKQLDVHGYGRLAIGPNAARRQVLAHRLAFYAWRGDTSLELDHLCRNPACVNPDHLEPVSHRENLMRGCGIAAQNARKSHCRHGHSLHDAILRKRGSRECRTCGRLRDAARASRPRRTRGGA